MTTLIQTNEKDREFAELQRQHEQTLAERNDLRIKLKSKEDEVRELQKTNESLTTKKLQGKIAILENDRATLQVRLRTVEAKIKRQENEIKDLTKQNEDRKEENRKLSANLQKVEYNLTKENEKLKEEMKDHKEENQRHLQAVEYKSEKLEGELKELKTTIAAKYSEQTIAFLNLGELCRQIQNSMYKRILPEHYTSGLTYKVKTIEEDLRDLPETEIKRKEALNNWKDLKSSLNWDAMIGRAVKALQSSRNTKAHPPINEASLREYASTLDHQELLKGWLSLEQVNKLIEIWKRLKQEEY